MFESLGLPLRYSECMYRVCFTNFLYPILARLRMFESGVLVVQSLSHSEEAIIQESEKLVCGRWEVSKRDSVLPLVPLQWNLQNRGHFRTSHFVFC